MNGLKQMLQLEKNRLERIVQKSKDNLTNAPEGKLRVTKTKKLIQFYHCREQEKNRHGVYLNKGKSELISQLAQKDYDEKVIKFAERRLRQVRALERNYQDNEIEQIFLKEHPERQRRIHPVEETWEQRLHRWIDEEYTGKEFREGTSVILTEKGERVRSKSEKILADFFYRNNIPYKYEKPLNLKGFGIVYPDFTFLSPVTHQEIYWEHEGRMDDPQYVERAIKKIHTYEMNNIYPGDRLILSFETEKIQLDVRIIQNLVNKYNLSKIQNNNS